MTGRAPIRRAFLAVVPPTVVLDAVDGVVSGLREADDRLRWTTRPQWHTTLQFLGRVDDGDAVTDVVGDVVGSCAPFATRLGGGGAFPKSERGSLLWLGHLGGDELGALAATVGAAAGTLGFAPDSRDFRPHVTLARGRAPRDLRPLVDALGGPIGPEWTVSEVVLFESDTHPDGARYTERARLPLAG